jgi:DNA-binding NarL/FixJ family response regulator
VAETRRWLVGTIRDAFGAQAHAMATCGEARTWLRNRAVGTPLLALIDIGLPDGSGVDLIEAMVNEDPAVVAIVTTIYEDDANLMNAFSAGAQGYLLKDQDEKAFVRRLSMIEHGDVPISPVIARRLLHRFRNDGPADTPLSPREMEVLRLIGRGLKANEAATVLGISAQTVTTHVKAIYRKLEISSRAEAALEAHRRGLT